MNGTKTLFDFSTAATTAGGMLPESTMLYQGNPAQTDPLHLTASPYSLSASHLIPNPQIQDLSFADSFSQPNSPSNSSLFELFTNTDAPVPTSNSTLADDYLKDHITSTPKATFATTHTTTTIPVPNHPISAPAPPPALAPAAIPAPTVTSVASYSQPPTSIPTTTTTTTTTTTSSSSSSTPSTTTTPASNFNNSSISNIFSTNPNQFFTTSPSTTTAFNSRSSSNAPAKPTFSSAAKPAFTPRTINPIATTKTLPFKISRARARHKQRLKAYKTRRNIEHLDLPYLHIPGDAVPPAPPSAIHMYSDARLSLAQVCWGRLTPMLEITRMYFQAYHDSETTSWGGRTADLLAEEKQRFKDEFLEHVHTFVPQIEAMKSFIELGRKDVGQFRTDFLLKGVDAMLVYMKEMKGQRAKEPLKEDDMLLLHKMFGQFGQILNTEFQIKWKFSKEKLVTGGGIEMEEYT